MAEGAPEAVTTAEVADCPVCRETYRDPRTLQCGHYFCRRCLEGVLSEGSIKCPTCRAESPVTPGSGVKGLHRPYLETLQEQVGGFLSQTKHQEITRHCDLCTDQPAMAAMFCYVCYVHFCDTCHGKHGEMTPSHKCVPTAESLFCKTHPKGVVVLICEDCRQGICTFCAFGDHAGHHKTEIEQVAEQCRQRLLDFIASESTVKNTRTLRRIGALLEEARKTDSEFKESMIKTKRLLKELEVKLDQLYTDITARLAAEIKTLVLYESDIKDLIDSRQSLVDHATYLTKQASDPELVEKGRDFPKTNESNIQYIENAVVELPAVGTILSDICDQLQQITKTCNIEFRKSKIGEWKKQHTMAVSHNVWGITVDMSRHRLVARTADTEGPLKMYSYDGQLVETLGSGIKGLAPISWRGICVDTIRDCYLAPCDSSLVVVNRAGRQTKSISVGSPSNCGVAYGRDDDIYLVSDITKHTVFLVKPTTAQVTRQFESHGSETTGFNHLFCIHVGTVAGVGRSCIMVCYRHNNHCIKLFDTSGKHMKTYGSPGASDGQLQYPRGVSTDAAGRVVVCDEGNKRVVSHWTDSAGQDHSECLLQDDWDNRQPRLLALDTENMIMAITDDTCKTLHIYN